MKTILKYKWVILVAILLFFIWIAFGKCAQKEPSYPDLLVKADEALLQGDYESADSLLRLFDIQQHSSDTSIQMYRNLLGLTRKYVDSQISLHDLAVVDSLCAYYEKNASNEKHVRALLFQGSIFSLINDLPNALKVLLAAKEEVLALEEKAPTVLGWVYQDIGDLYFKQRLFKECIFYYREFYRLSSERNDTLRMAHSMNRMAKVFMIPDPYSGQFHIDSIEYYQKKAIQLAKNLPQAKNIVPYVQHSLCDIYIQIEQFDKALAIMPRDEQNLDNWAYWHYGQNHVDSAIYYFRQSIGKSGPAFDAEYLRILTQLEQERGNTAQALADYRALMAAEDSAKALSQAEATRQAAALHEYETIVAERNDIASKNQQLVRLIGAIVFGMAVVFGGAGVYGWKRKAKKRKEHAQQDLPENEVARQEPETATEDAPEQQTATGQQEQQTATEQQELLAAELEGSDIYRRLRNTAPGIRRQLSDDEWLWLGERLDALHHNMGQRLQQLARLSPTELRLCYLTRLGMTSTEMADVLCKSVSAVSHARFRLAKKVLGDRADIDNLNDLIMRY